MSNKQEELEAIIQLESYNLITITEMWWDEMHKQSISVDSCKQFKRYRQGWRGKNIALYIKKWIDATELSLKSNYEQVESLWVRMRGQANKGNLMVGVYYKPPDQGEDVDKMFLLQLQNASCLQAVILLEDLNHPDICWKYSTENCKQPSRLLKRVKDCF